MRLLTGVLLAVAAVSVDWTVTRRMDVTFDGTRLTLVEGEERDIPCTHALGKTHHVKVEQGKTSEFNGLGVHLEFDSRMSVNVEAHGSSTAARFMHASGSFFTLQPISSTPDPDYIKETLELHSRRISN